MSTTTLKCSSSEKKKSKKSVRRLPSVAKPDLVENGTKGSKELREGRREGRRKREEGERSEAEVARRQKELRSGKHEKYKPRSNHTETQKIDETAN